jgi:hypothetical protein
MMSLRSRRVRALPAVCVRQVGRVWPRRDQHTQMHHCPAKDLRHRFRICDRAASTATAARHPALALAAAPRAAALSDTRCSATAAAIAATTAAEPPTTKPLAANATARATFPATVPAARATRRAARRPTRS